jgi:hypothetical protein
MDMAPKKKPEDELKNQRIPIMMTEAELKLIDDWSFKNRIRSRGEAIRRLCNIGVFASDELPGIHSTSDKMVELMAGAIRAANRGNDRLAVNMFTDLIDKHVIPLLDATVSLAGKTDAYTTGTLQEAADEVEMLKDWYEAKKTT